MTTIEVFHRGALISGFSAKGHTGYAEEGEDIVCAAVSGILFAVIPFDKGLLLALMLQYTLPAPFIIPLFADLGDDAEYVSTTLSLGTVLAVVLFFFLAAFSLA